MQAWWEPRGVLRRFVADLLADELARLRRSSVPPPAGWSGDLRLDADLGVDSLEHMNLASALAEALQLYESGIEDYLLARRTLGEWMDIAQAGLARFDERLVFRTSGSTGVPKPCVHALATLRQEVLHLASHFPGRRRVLCAVPSHHIYGFLFGVLLPGELGISADSVQDLRTGTPAWLARVAQPGDLVIAHPEFWRALAGGVARLPVDVFGVTSTGPCPDDVAEGVLRVGLDRLVQVYGASETAGIAARRSHEEPYTLFPYWRFDRSNAQWLVRALPDGGEQVVALPDALVPCSERMFRLGARHDEAVQVAGVNVFPARVREVLCRHPSVQDAAVRLMRPEEGARLKAFVVPAQGAPPEPELLADLRAWIARELAPVERPTSLRLGTALPRSASGKLADWLLDE
jgi:long-chain acyl-CoA synthetase